MGWETVHIYATSAARRRLIECPILSAQFARRLQDPPVYCTNCQHCSFSATLQKAAGGSKARGPCTCNGARQMDHWCGGGHWLSASCKLSKLGTGWCGVRADLRNSDICQIWNPHPKTDMLASALPTCTSKTAGYGLVHMIQLTMVEEMLSPCKWCDVMCLQGSSHQKYQELKNKSRHRVLRILETPY